MLAKLPKPTPAAWAANQVAREEPDLIATLLDAGAALRAAQDAALAGGGAENLRDRDPGRAPRRRRRDARRRRAQARRQAALARDGRPAPHHAARRRRRPRLRAALSAGRLVGEAQAGGTWPFALETDRCSRAAAEAEARGQAEAGEGRDDDAAEREAEERAARERLALEDELREARGTLKVRERVAKGAEEDAQAAAKRSTPRRPRSTRPARPWRTRRPSRSQRSGCSRARARSATRPATPSRGSKNGWIDGAPPLGSSRRWLN